MPTDTPEPRPETGKPHDHGKSDNLELIFSLSCGALLLAGWLGPELGLLPGWLALTLLVAAYGFGAFFALREATEKLLAGRFEIDFLMLVAATGAAILGAWAEGALLLFLFSLGHALEHYAMGRATRAIQALADLAPDSALVRRNGETVEIRIENIQLGDIVVVRSNERLPVDGVVTSGESSVNQAPITGESAPIDKRPLTGTSAAEIAAAGPEHKVFAGSINGSGSLDIYVTRLSSESALARVVKLVSEAETRQSPTQTFIKRFEKFFVPLVIALAVLTAFSWLVFDETASESFYRAMAVLVAASPCALAIATPSAILSGIARAARGGVLIKGGAPLEALGRLDAIAFDKTGTLTIGAPKVVDILTFGTTEADALLATAASVEAFSDHPLARAIVQEAQDKGLAKRPEAADFRSLTGKGVSAVVDGDVVLIGKPALFDGETGPVMPEALAAQVEALFDKGRTMMVIAQGDRFLGAIGLMDTPRPAARRVIARIRELGLTRMMMISGDNHRVANAIARDLGLDEAFGDLMPDDKVARIRELKQQGGVAMVGDGVNDAPAMATADVGIAMGAAGSDVALETADIALMADNLDTLPFAVGLSRATSRNIRQNLWVSLGVVALLVPATLFGLGIGPAILLHEGSTLIVVANALRLLAYRDA
jgi:Zn2+/Cd2+-exporting ATPase